MDLTVTSTGIVVKVKWSPTCARARQMQNTFVTGIFLPKVPALLDCDIITKTLATFAVWFSKDFTLYILRCVLRHVFQFQVQLPALMATLRPWSVRIPWTWYKKKPQPQCNLGQPGSSSQTAPGGCRCCHKVPRLSWNGREQLRATEPRLGTNCLDSEPPVRRCWAGCQTFY